MPDDETFPGPYGDECFGPEWEEKTKTIRAWICHGAVNRVDLVTELIYWARYTSIVQ